MKAQSVCRDPAPSTHDRRQWQFVVRVSLLALAIVLPLSGIWAYRHFHLRYQYSDQMVVPIQEVSTADYPEDPAARSVHYGQYNGRRLRLIQRDDRHFDFVFESDQDHTAEITLRNIDVSLMTPSVPPWCLDNDGLVRIALIDREWNRQQVWFDRDSQHIEVQGGDGFEQKRLYKVALAKNCLNAGLWEIILAVEETGTKRMYYQGWFTFPMGHYRRLIEQNTGLDYAKHWYQLEHWFDPAGTEIAMDQLRTVHHEDTVDVRFNPTESLIMSGEQLRKRRTFNGTNLVSWGDVLSNESAEFATFVPPGRYSVAHPWGNEYWRLAKFERAIVRDVSTRAPNQRPLHELELVFRSKDGKPQRFIVGGVDLQQLPQLPTSDYPRGLYMPMGIGVPPFYQEYNDLTSRPPDRSPYYSFLLDAKHRWIDHHKSAIDGPVLHRDAQNPNLLHVYLLSYERHSLVAHFEIQLDQIPSVANRNAKEMSPH